MVKHYLILTWRNLLKQRFFAFLNILGLSLGMGVCMIVFQYIQDERRFDQFHKHKDRIYRINQTSIWSDEEAPFASTGPNVAVAIKEAVPEVQSVARIHTPGQMWGSYLEGNDQSTFLEQKILAADSNVFSIFTATFLQGESKHALQAPYSVVMTVSAAERYFGENYSQALGKIISLRNNKEERAYQVTGVVEDWPTQSHFHFEMMLSMNSFPQVQEMEWSWIWTTFVTYVLLEEGASSDKFAERIHRLPALYAEETLTRVMGITYEQYEAQGKEWELFAQLLTGIRLYSGATFNRLGPEGDIQTLYILGIIALLVLFLSSINYMNLATASATRRAKEVGIQKVLGSTRKQLAQFFYAESVFYCLLALSIAFIWVPIALPYFNEISAKQLSFPLAWPMLGWIGFATLVGLGAGLYPANYLSAFKAVTVLSGKFIRGKKSMRFRNALVVIQFSISSLLIISTFIVADQLQFLRDKKAGFDKEQVVIIPHAEQLENRLVAFRNELLKESNISEVGLSNSSPPAIWSDDYFLPSDQKEIKLPISFILVNSGYVPALGIPLLAGRNFMLDNEADNDHVILNETAVRQLGWHSGEESFNYREVIGKTLTYPGRERDFSVIGVMKDIHYQSFHGPIEPLALFTFEAGMFTNGNQFASVRLRLDKYNFSATEETVSHIEEIWKEVTVSVPFSYSFLDDDFFAAFQAEQRLQAVLRLLTGLAIFIACLGLLGLIAFTVELRSKEMGIRKVLGASVGHILQLLSWDLAKWVLIGFSLSIPVSYLIMQQWLNTFLYRMPLSVVPFMWAIGLLVMIAMITMSYHAIRTATTNPVNSLKEE